jgi:Fe-S-cluster containining protein
VTADPAHWAAEARAAFAAARDPAGLARAVVTFHRRVDDVLAASVRGHGVATACALGCNHCCHLRLTVQPYEAFALAAWLRRRFSPAELTAVTARLEDNAARTREMGVEARKRTNLRCALLGDDGACTAYEARPAQCRRYHSLRLETCKSFYDNPADDTLESPLHPALAHNAAVLITQSQHAVRDEGLDAEPEDINLALLEALANPKAWRRWRDGKKPFPAR